MIFFGHLGIGSLLASPFRKGLPKRWVLVGTILPDLMDKPIYYGLVLITGKHAQELAPLTGTRLFGHTALFLLVISIFATIRRSRRFAALALGIATHLILDGMTDYYGQITSGQPRASALLWPFKSFPIIPHQTVHDHVSSWNNPFLLAAEVGGALLLGWDLWKKQHHAEIIAFFQRRRIERAKKSKQY